MMLLISHLQQSSGNKPIFTLILMKKLVRLLSSQKSSRARVIHTCLYKNTVISVLHTQGDISESVDFSRRLRHKTTTLKLCTDPKHFSQ